MEIFPVPLRTFGIKSLLIDIRYQAIVDHLSQKRADTGFEEVQQAYRQVIQHVYALFFLIDHIIIQNKPLSETLLQQTHHILTDGINAENSERDPSTTYGGLYRTEDVGWTPFSSFATPLSIPIRIASAILEFNTTSRQSETTKVVDPYQLAAKVSQQILNIHPFLDGNSRLSRIILNTVLLKYTGTIIPFGKDPIEAAKWKETVARALEMESEAEELGEDSTVPWKEVATLILIQGGREMMRLNDIVMGQNKEKVRGEAGEGYPWEGNTEKDDIFVGEMWKRMGWKVWSEESGEDKI